MSDIPRVSCITCAVLILTLFSASLLGARCSNDRENAGRTADASDCDFIAHQLCFRSRGSRCLPPVHQTFVMLISGLRRH